jgi:hypothetical protein
LAEFAAALRPQLGIGSQVVNMAAIADCSGNGRPVANVSMDHINTALGQVGTSSSRKFEDADKMPGFDKSLNQMTADETSSASY